MIYDITGADGEYEEGEGGDNEWSRGTGRAGGDDSIWDDAGSGGGSGAVGGAAGLDLADFAAAALKFRSETRNMNLAEMGFDDGGSHVQEEDAMERLLREQNDALNEVEANDDDKNEPEWADADVNEPIKISGEVPNGGAGSETKRNLLFSVNQLPHEIYYLSINLS